MIYSVEPVHHDEGRYGKMVHVEAAGPTQAAEVVLGRNLVTAGSSDQLRCRVWWLDDRFEIRSVPLFEPALPTTSAEAGG